MCSEHSAELRTDSPAKIVDSRCAGFEGRKGSDVQLQAGSRLRENTGDEYKVLHQAMEMF